jgi:hypothetical protein
LHIRVLHADLEGQQIALPAAAIVNDRIGGGAAGLLIVEGEMLDAGDDMLGLDRVQMRGCDFARQDGVFALGLKGAAIARFAADEVMLPPRFTLMP